MTQGHEDPEVELIKDNFRNALPISYLSRFENQ